MPVWNLEDRALWARLEAFDMDLSGASLPFSARLARDNEWDEEFAARVVLEYKRFVFLAMRANHPVTPSDEVDQAWHLHLCYTRSYWDEMCAQVLGGPLHHGPTQGGRAEGEKFADWYEKTLDSYREWFEIEPPREIWPPSAERFGLAPHFRRVNAKRVWVIAKSKWLASGALKLRLPRVGLPRRDWLRIAPLGWLWMLAGCAGVQTELQREGPNVFNWHGGPFLIWFWTLCALGIGFGIWRKNAEMRPLDAVFPMAPLDAPLVARLRDDKDGAVDVALAILYRKGALEVTPAGTLRATNVPIALTPFESAVLAQFQTSALTPGENSVRGVRQLLRRELLRLDEQLRGLGLLVSTQTQRSADNWPLGMTLGMLALGVIKIMVGISRDRPVGFLVGSCAVLSGFAAYFVTHPARRSKRGEAYLAHLNQQKFRPVQAADADAMALHMALVGMAAYPPEMQRAMRPPSSSDGGSSGGEYSGGSGCSSSSGGDSGGGDGGGGGGGGDGGGCGGGGCGGCGG